MTPLHTIKSSWAGVQVSPIIMTLMDHSTYQMRSSILTIAQTWYTERSRHHWGGLNHQINSHVGIVPVHPDATCDCTHIHTPREDCGNAIQTCQQPRYAGDLACCVVEDTSVQTGTNTCQGLFSKDFTTPTLFMTRCSCEHCRNQVFFKEGFCYPMYNHAISAAAVNHWSPQITRLHASKNPTSMCFDLMNSVLSSLTAPWTPWLPNVIGTMVQGTLSRDSNFVKQSASHMVHTYYFCIQIE